MGLPSSSFEFVSVLIDDIKNEDLIDKILNDKPKQFGVFINKGYLTNLRECLSVADNVPFNTTKEDIEFIRNNIFTYKIEMDIVTARQWLRHRTGSYQEKSRRFTKDNVIIYTPDSLNKVMVEDTFGNFYDIKNILDLLEKFYKEALKKTSAQEARYILPLGLMTTIWISGDKNYWRNFINLRTDKHAQPEIKRFAEVIKMDLGDVLNED